jgi:hypothetical protein
MFADEVPYAVYDCESAGTGFAGSTGSRSPGGDATVNTASRSILAHAHAGATR